jgi:Protein phosphatase 2C
MPPPWKTLWASAMGTSHAASERPCQDCGRVRVWSSVAEAVLLAVCADGAGSAEHSHMGARIACESVIEAVSRDLDHGGLTPFVAETIDDDRILGWLGEARNSIRLEAEASGMTVRDLACTLLLAVLGEQSALFVQIGDGVIVVADGDSFGLVFWPESGEYEGETDFLTDEVFADHIRVERRAGRIDELALLSDGLQRLALDYAARQPHGPFFAPLFQHLRTHDPESLQGDLSRFLDSPRVNQRTDDDKTLILASRPVGTPGHAPPPA